MKRVGDLAGFVAGFIAAEGSFVSGSRFAFSVGLGETDASTCDLLMNWFGVGRLQRYNRRRPHYDDEISFVVSRHRDLINVIVPFMDEHLPDSYKRTQYETWRCQVLEYWECGAKRQRSCSETGCDELRRAKGLCRAHYYIAFGR